MVRGWRTVLLRLQVGLEMALWARVFLEGEQWIEHPTKKW